MCVCVIAVHIYAEPNSCFHVHYTDSSMDEEVFLDYHIKKNDTVWLLLGDTGTGLGSVGNLIFGKTVFPEFIAAHLYKRNRTRLHCNLTSLESFNRRMCIIVPPDLGRSDKNSSESDFITDLTEILLMTRLGVDAFLIVIDLNARGEALDGLFKYLQRSVHILGNYWNHSILVMTNGNQLSENEDEQYKQYQELLETSYILQKWKVVEKVNNRFVIVEGKKWDNNYREGVLRRLLEMSDDLESRYHYILQYIVSETITAAKQQQMKGNATDIFHWVIRLVNSVLQLNSTKHADKEITELKLEYLGYCITRYLEISKSI